MAPRRLLFVVCVLQLGCGSDPPTTPTTSTPAPPTSVALSGRVIESRAGEPVAEAFVSIVRPGESLQPRATTDDHGAFQFNDLRPGDITVRVVKTGFEAQERTLTLAADTSLLFQLVPRLYLLSGRVTELNTGTPLAGATLTILDGPNVSRTTVTNTDGTFAMVDLAYSGFVLRVRLAGYDSVFAGIPMSGDTARNFELRRAEQSLAGTWTGTVSTGPNSSSHIPEVTLTHSGAAIGTVGGLVPSPCSFSGTIREPARIGSTTEVTGTVTCNMTRGPARGPINCRGVGDFTGTVNWSQLRIAAPRVVYECADAAPHPATFSLVRQQ